MWVVIRQGKNRKQLTIVMMMMMMRRRRRRRRNEYEICQSSEELYLLGHISLLPVSRCSLPCLLFDPEVRGEMFHLNFG
jgi:hypothetical protein